MLPLPTIFILHFGTVPTVCFLHCPSGMFLVLAFPKLVSLSTYVHNTLAYVKVSCTHTCINVSCTHTYFVYTYNNVSCTDIIMFCVHI